MRSAATLAIAAARAGSRWPAAIMLIALCAGAGVGLRALHAPFWLLANLLFTSAIAIVVAYVNGRPAQDDALTVVEDAAPLFGRQRARANAIFPSAVVLLGAAAQYLGAVLTSTAGISPVFFLLDAIGAIAALQIALSAPLRSRWNQALYVALSIGGALLCGGVGMTLLLATHSEAAAAVVSAILALPIGFVALRQYGEALARYDPLPSAS